MKRLLNVAVKGLVLSAALGFALGQTDEKLPVTPEAKPSTKGTAADPTTEPKPGPQIEKLLRALEGTWSIKEKLAPDAALPRGATGAGKIVWRRGPGGFSVIRRLPVEARLAGDHRARRILVGRCGTGLPHNLVRQHKPRRMHQLQECGPLGRRSLVLVEDYEVNRKRFIFKEVFGSITPGAFTQTLYGGDSSKELKVDQTIQATKLPGSAS